MVKHENIINFNELNLRPKKLNQYVGQTNIIKTLRLFIDAVKKRKFPSEHILFYGPPGIGKTTLSYIIANELEGDIKITSGAAIGKSGDLAAILTNLNDNDVLFIDEIHRLHKSIEEMLYSVLEDYCLNIVIGKGPSARAVRLSIPKITIIGATTKLALLSAPLRDRFGLLLRLDYYKKEEIVDILVRASDILKMPLDKDAALQIAKRSRKTPRVANRILKRARDIFEVKNHKKIDNELLDKLFSLLEIDDMGLTNMDLKYLKLLAIKFENTPVGIETISLSLSEDRRTIEEFIEPYLLQIGFIKKTSRGRILTNNAFKHMNMKSKERKIEQNKLV